ncbi:unnamed protein product, partial [Ectocarpus sp. 12 AP-2014]
SSLPRVSGDSQRGRGRVQGKWSRRQSFERDAGKVQAGESLAVGSDGSGHAGRANPARPVQGRGARPRDPVRLRRERSADQEAGSRVRPGPGRGGA